MLSLFGQSETWVSLETVQNRKTCHFFSVGEMFGYTATLWKNHEYSDWPETRPQFGFLGKAGRRLWRMTEHAIHFAIA